MADAMIGAIEAGGTKFVIALADSAGTIRERERIPTRGPAETFAELTAFFTAAADRHGTIGGFGVASFGPIDIDRDSPTCGTFTNTPKPGWSGASFATALAPFGAPLRIDSDVNGAALGEWLAGAGQGCRTLAYTTVGTGIGTGLVHDGASRTGFSHYESGHLRPPHDVARDPFAGACPFHGDCLEGLASGPAILKRWGRSLDQLGPAEGEMIAGYLGHLAATLVLLHMPDRLVFGGGVLHTPGLLASIRRAAEAELAGYIAHPRLAPGLESYIVGPGLGDDAGLTGAIELGRRALAHR